MSLILPLVLGTSCLGGVVHGAFHRNSPLFGRVLHRLPGRARRVALTFDDGPNAVTTPLVLDALHEHGVAATFFLLGAAVERHPRMARRIVAEGHEVGNHGWSHRKLHMCTPRAAREEMAGGADAIERACGVRPRFFRAPHGFRAPWVTAIARGLGERTVGWSVGVWDSARPGVPAIVARSLRGARPGAIILLHDGDGDDTDGDRRQTALALLQIIAGLRARGYEFATLPPS